MKLLFKAAEEADPSSSDYDDRSIQRFNQWGNGKKKAAEVIEWSANCLLDRTLPQGMTHEDEQKPLAPMCFCSRVLGMLTVHGSKSSHVTSSKDRLPNPLSRCHQHPVAWRSRSPSVVLEVISRHPAWDPLYVGAFGQRKSTDLTVGIENIRPGCGAASSHRGMFLVH